MLFSHLFSARCVRERGAWVCVQAHKQLFSDAQGFNDLSQCVQLGPCPRPKSTKIFHLKSKIWARGPNSALQTLSCSFGAEMIFSQRCHNAFIPFIVETPPCKVGAHCIPLHTKEERIRHDMDRSFLSASCFMLAYTMSTEYNLFKIGIVYLKKSW